MNSYTITYEPSRMGSEDGYWWRITMRGRVVGEGWAHGKQANAVRDAKRELVSISRAA